MKKNNKYIKLINLDIVDSTNNYAFTLAEKGQKEVTVIRAVTQTSGKGRLARKWDSPPEKGIYVSFLFRPENPISEIYILPLIMALGVSKVLSPIIANYIKWPNDVMIKDKKVAGCLIEARSNSEKVDFVIAGIGLNINSNLNDIPSIGTSLKIETGNIHDQGEIFKKLTTEILNLYNDFKKGNINILIKQILDICLEKDKLIIIENLMIIEKLKTEYKNLTKSNNQLKGVINLK
ncbi:MAG: biotin--[acetyl-CoA-carboxylase] ligase [Candidatus Omnitrophica bacterium]|nr:biotin--[acetyl-CoA-carboxylase] ligase [Candidatus Omnitrophota bacterium]